MTSTARINELRTLIRNGEYRVDPDAVASAMVSRWMEERAITHGREHAPVEIARAA